MSNFSSNKNMKDPSVLDSLRYYDALRLNATGNITRPFHSNVDVVYDPEREETVALCHLSGFFPFTTGSYEPNIRAHEDAANVALAIHHLNTGDGSIVPEVAGLDQRCRVRFTTEMADTEYQGGVALAHVINQTSREPQGQRPVPCAFVGAYRSAVSIPMSIVTGLLGYPQVSPDSTSADLDDKSQYPLFARSVPSDAGTAVPIIHYFANVLQASHLVVVNVNDAYGNAFVEGLRAAALDIAPDLMLQQIPLDYQQDDDKSSIQAAVQSIKHTGYRYVFCIVFTEETHDSLMLEAYNQGVAGTGVHNWLFADSFGGILDGRNFDEGSPLALAYRGTAQVQVSGGVPGMPSYDNYVTNMQQLRNPTDLTYIGNLFPKHFDQPAYGTEVPFVHTDDYLMEMINVFGPLAYEATIALGLAACDAYHADTQLLKGVEHYAQLVQTQFKGISGHVQFNNETGTRDPSSSLYSVSNYVLQQAPGATPGQVEFVPVVTDLFQEGKWVNQVPYLFNDGTSNIPVDIAPPQENAPQWGLFIGLPVALLFVAGVALFIFYENKRKQNDSVWKVKRDELHFAEPPEIIGRGTFGLVLLAEYRGTQVAVKRVIPPKSKTDGSKSGSKKTSGSTSGMQSGMGTQSGVGHSSWGGRSLTNSAESSGSSKMTSMILGQGFAQQPTQASVLRKLKHEFIEEMRYLSRLRHPCITTVMGAVIDKAEPMLILEYMDHGSLYDLLHNDTIILEGETLLPLLRDVTQGVRFLHSADPQVIHGDLKAANILVDTRFRAKVADFGLSQKKNLGGTGTPFWMAPELLRGETTNTAASDVYSFGIILYEVYSRRDPYDGENADDVLRLVTDKSVNKRPPVPRNMPKQVQSLMSDCVEADPAIRPSFEELDMRLKRADASNIDPGQKVKNAHVSLFDIFPRHVAEALRDGRTVEPEHKDCVTIFFSDIVGFTQISSRLEPRKIASLLDRLYSKFDRLSTQHDIFKVETIGDAYMAVTNLVKDQQNDHAKRIAEFAIAAIAAANSTFIDDEDQSRGVVNIRVGFHSGPVVADVVGTRNPRYCLFGDTVNTASRMESNSERNRIHCSRASAKLLRKQCKEIPLSSRGRIPIKGKGDMHTFWVNEGGLDGSHNNGMDQSADDCSKDFTVPEAAPEAPVVPPRREAAKSPKSTMNALVEGREESSEFELSGELQLAPILDLEAPPTIPEDSVLHQEMNASLTVAQLNASMSSRAGYNNNRSTRNNNSSYLSVRSECSC